MQKITIYLALLLLLVPAGVSAQQPEALNVQTNAGTEQSILLESIQNVAFVGDALVFTTTSGTFQIPIDDIYNIVFGQKKGGIATDIADVEMSDSHISLEGNTLTIESGATINALYLVDITGKLLASQKLSAVSKTTITLPNVGAFVLFLETSQGYVARKVIMN
jgi:hypothetical protein